jgi:hypothetical protein
MKITKNYLKQLIKEEINKVNEADQGGDVFTRLLDQIDQKAKANMTDQQKADYENKKQLSIEHFKKLDAQSQNVINAGIQKANKENDENKKAELYSMLLWGASLAVPSMFYLSKYIMPALGLNEEETK